jgi:hypothetical protein
MRVAATADPAGPAHGSSGPAAPCIGYVSPSGWGNLGDEAIQQALVAGIRARWPAARIRAFTLNPAVTAAYHGIEAEPITGLSRPHSPIRVPDPPALCRALETLVRRTRRPWRLHLLLRT